MFLYLWTSCSPLPQGPTAADILGNPNYQAISYGGYRAISRDTVPSVDQIKDDMRILSAMDVKILRTYNTELAELPNLLQAISELKQEDSSFEMYVMVGAWINCKDAWTDHPDHTQEDEPYNEAEVQRAVQYAKQYPDNIIKMIAVGNEAMVHWATSYFVPPSVILKWVNYLQELKNEGDLPSDLWITSSDDFAAWGGASDNYHTEDLNRLITAVDFISMHTHAFHNSHYNKDYWYNRDPSLSEIEQIDASMQRAGEFAAGQYNDVKQYMLRIWESTNQFILERLVGQLPQTVFMEQRVHKQPTSIKQKSIMIICESGRKKTALAAFISKLSMSHGKMPKTRWDLKIILGCLQLTEKQSMPCGVQLIKEFFLD